MQSALPPTYVAIRSTSVPTHSIVGPPHGDRLARPLRYGEVAGA